MLALVLVDALDVDVEEPVVVDRARYAKRSTIRSASNRSADAINLRSFALWHSYFVCTEMTY